MNDSYFEDSLIAKGTILKVSNSENANQAIGLI
jgi:hypothetical protein